jgi:hypothetical protein
LTVRRLESSAFTIDVQVIDLLFQVLYSDLSPAGGVSSATLTFSFPGQISTSPMFLDETSTFTVTVCIFILSLVWTLKLKTDESRF